MSVFSSFSKIIAALHGDYIVMFSLHTLFWLDVKLYSWYTNSQPDQIMKFVMGLALFEHIYMMNGTKVLHEISEILCSWPNSVSKKHIEDFSQTTIIFENMAYKKNITVTHEVKEDLSPNTYVLIWLKCNNRALLYTGINIRKVAINI